MTFIVSYLCGSPTGLWTKKATIQAENKQEVKEKASRLPQFQKLLLIQSEKEEWL